MSDIVFYTTVGCQLCDEALLMVRTIVPDYDDLNIDETEISNSDELMSRYAVRIPVVGLRGQSAELGWPFDESMLREYLDRHCDVA